MLPDASTEGSATPLPAYIPPNSYRPFMLAIGIMFFVWSPALLYMQPWVVLAVGTILMVVNIGGWVREILHDWEVRDGG